MCLRTVALVTAENPVYPLCSSNHIFAQCEQFKALAVNDRIARIKKLKICFNCLRTGHENKAATVRANNVRTTL